MKTKGIPFWEQHLEHIVLGVAVLAFLAIVALQFIGSPNAVEVPQFGSVGPAEVDGKLEADAKALADQLAPSAASPVPELADPTPVAETFQHLKLAAVSPTAQIFASAPSLNPVPAIGSITTGAPFVVAAVPAPTELVYDQYFDALTDEVVETIPELKAVFPKKPYDVTWTTVGGRFNVAGVLDQFRKPGPNGEAALPASWHNDRVDFIDIKLEREEYVDGKWTNSTIVDALPGLYSLRPRLKEKIDAPLRNEIIAYVSDPAVRNQIIQPEFYDTKGNNWHPPVGSAPVPVAAPGANVGNAAVGAGAVQEQLQELKDSLESKKQERDRLLKKIKDNRCPQEEKPPADNKGGRGDAPGSSSEGPSGRGLGMPSSDQKVNLVECDKMRKRVRVLDKTIKSIEEALARLEPNVEIEEAAPVEADVKVVEVVPDVIDVWAHDMTVQPGRTYRYRMFVEVYNPLFAKKLDLPEAQQALAEQFTLKSEPSEWTSPIEIRPWLQVFITEAMPTGAGGMMGAAFGQAKAEVFRFSDGQCWSERFIVQPGDRIGGTDAAKPGKADEAVAQVDFATDWFVLDVVENIDADKNLQSRNWAAHVLLQNITKEDVSQIRVPQVDATSRELKRLRELATLTKLSNAKAQAN